MYFRALAGRPVTPQGLYAQARDAAGVSCSGLSQLSRPPGLELWILVRSLLGWKGGEAAAPRAALLDPGAGGLEL